MKLTYLLAGALLLSPPAASAEAQRAFKDVTACVERNLPEPDTIRAVRIVARDRLGAQNVTVVRLYGRSAEGGRRQLLVEFVNPEDLRGAKLLMLEGADGSEIYFKSGEFSKVKRIGGVARAASLFESDFSYEDFQHLQGFSSPGESKRIEDAMVGDRPAYVVQTRPAEAANSAYESIVTAVDKETCIPLRIDFYEPGRRLRKELTVDTAELSKRGSVWVAHAILLRDIRDYTTTLLLVDSTEQEVLPADMFTVQGFQRTAAPGNAD